MIGGGFGGSALALVPVDAVEEISAQVRSAFGGAGFAPPTLLRVEPAAGAARLELDDT